MTLPVETIRSEGFDVQIDPGHHRKSHVDTVHEVQTRDIYRLRQLLGADIRQVVDIGAHIGTFTMLAGKLFPNAWIWSFEASPTYFPYLVLNAPVNASPINLAVIGFYGQKLEREFYPGNKDLIRWRARTGGAINMASLFELCPTIDLLKLDCEEAEVEILREMESLGKVGSIPIIVGEWHFQTAKEEVRRILSPTHNVELVDVADWNMFWAIRK